MVQRDFSSWGKATIPPRKDAVMWDNDLEGGEVYSRNQVIERIAEVGRQQWKQECSYHRRSLAETAILT